LEGPEGLRGDRVREDGLVGVAADRQGEGQTQDVGLVAAEDGREAGQDLRLERMDVAFPRPGRGVRVLEQRGQAPLLDNETRVEPSDVEGDTALDAPGAAHEPSIRRPSIKPYPPSKRFSTAFRIRRQGSRVVWTH